MCRIHRDFWFDRVGSALISAGTHMWQVAQQYDGRSEDDALTPPRFLAQPGSGLAWQDGSNGVNSTPPAALLPSDCESNEPALNRKLLAHELNSRLCPLACSSHYS